MSWRSFYQFQGVSKGGYHLGMSIGGLVLLALSLLCFTVQSASSQSKVGVVCLGSKDKILVRTKCLSGETKLSTTVLSQKASSGDTGATGPEGALGRAIVISSQNNVQVPQGGSEFSASCPDGKTTVSGGCYSSNPLVFLNQSYPFDGSPNKWTCRFVPLVDLSSSSELTNLIAYAVCAHQ